MEQEKKNIDATCKRPFYHEREIWWCSLGTNIGFEQDVTGTGYERPAVVLRAFSTLTCFVVPLTTSNKENQYHMNANAILDEQAFAIISQMRLIDTKRLKERIGYMGQEEFAHIRKAIKGML